MTPFGYYGARYAIEVLSAEGVVPNSSRRPRPSPPWSGRSSRKRLARCSSRITSPKMAEMLARSPERCWGNGVFRCVVASRRASGYVSGDDAAQHDAVRGGHAAEPLERRPSAGKSTPSKGSCRHRNRGLFDRGCGGMPSECSLDKAVGVSKPPTSRQQEGHRRRIRPAGARRQATSDRRGGSHQTAFACCSRRRVRTVDAPCQ